MLTYVPSIVAILSMLVMVAVNPFTFMILFSETLKHGQKYPYMYLAVLAIPSAVIAFIWTTIKLIRIKGIKRRNQYQHVGELFLCAFLKAAEYLCIAI